MNTVKKIFEGMIDEGVHAEFLKFGRGEYKGKYLLEGRRQAKNWSIKGGAEFVNFFVRRCLEKVSGPIAISGVIVSTLDLKNEIGFEVKKSSNFQGVRKFQVDCEIEPSQVFDLMDKYPRVFFALSFRGDDFVLKIKAKAPTSGKPGKGKGDGPVADFCSLKTGDRSIVDDLFFGAGEFAEVRISHTIVVSDIVYPTNVEELGPAEVREMAKRKGKIIRVVVVDGVEKVSEAEFVA